jgi:hypothetical protein
LFSQIQRLPILENVVEIGTHPLQKSVVLSSAFLQTFPFPFQSIGTQNGLLSISDSLVEIALTSIDLRDCDVCW